MASTKSKITPTVRILNQGLPEMVHHSKISPHPHNPRKGDVDGIVESLRTNGWWGVLVVQRSTSYIIVGNHRFKAGRRLGMDEFPVVWVDVEDMEAERIVVADNRLGDLGSYDRSLADMLERLAGTGPGLEGLGYTTEGLERLLRETRGVEAEERLASGGGDTPTADDDVVEVDDPVISDGEEWAVGPHRVLCGDSCDKKRMKVFLGRTNPTCCMTDPPYGIKYDPAWRGKALGKKTRSNTRIIDDDQANWMEALIPYTGHVLYQWYGVMRSREVFTALAAGGFELRSQIVWAKNSFPISRGHYHWQHEAAAYCVREGETANWCGDRKQTTLWSVPVLGRGEREEGGSHTNHSTQKPVELYLRAYRNHCNPGDHVYEPFLGSGTAIVAAHRLGLIAICAEVDPRWVQASLVRARRVTGIEPTRISDGATLTSLGV